MIVTFSNIKGGVGKSTFLRIFANYFSIAKGEKVLVIDADSNQESINTRRKKDIAEEVGEDYDFPYEIKVISPASAIDVLVDYHTNRDTSPYDKILIDLPGSLTIPCLPQCLSLSDVIVTPTQAGDEDFLKTIDFVNHILEMFEDSRPPKLIGIFNKDFPNSLIMRERVKEIEEYREIIDFLSQPVPFAPAKMQTDVNTYSLLDFTSGKGKVDIVAKICEEFEMKVNEYYNIKE